MDGDVNFVQLLKEGVKFGQEFLAGHREQIRGFLDSLNVEEGLDTEKWVKRSHDSDRPTQKPSSTKKKHGHDASVMQFMAELFRLKATYDNGQLDYSEVYPLLEQAVDLLADSPQYGKVILNYILEANPKMRRKADELVNKLLPLLLDALSHGSVDAIFDKKVLLPTLDIVFELFLSDDNRKKVSLLLEPSIDLVHHTIVVLSRWNENSTSKAKQSEIPNVTEIFEAILLRDVRNLSRLIGRSDAMVKKLSNLPSKVSADKRHVDTLVAGLLELSKRARKLEAAVDDRDSDVIEMSLRALPTFQRIVRDVKGGAGRHFERRDPEIHRMLNDIGDAVEMNTRRMTGLQKMVQDVKNWGDTFDVRVLARDLLGVIDGIPKFEPIAAAIRAIANQLDGIQQIDT